MWATKKNKNDIIDTFSHLVNSSVRVSLARARVYLCVCMWVRMVSLVFHYQTDSMIMRSACDAYKSVPKTKLNTTKTKSQTTGNAQKKNETKRNAYKQRGLRLDGCQSDVCSMYMEFLLRTLVCVCVCYGNTLSRHLAAYRFCFVISGFGFSSARASVEYIFYLLLSRWLYWLVSPWQHNDVGEYEITVVRSSLPIQPNVNGTMSFHGRMAPTLPIYSFVQFLDFLFVYVGLWALFFSIRLCPICSGPLMAIMLTIVMCIYFHLNEMCVSLTRWSVFVSRIK